MKKRYSRYVVGMLLAAAVAGPFVFGDAPYQFLHQVGGPNFFSLIHDTLRPTVVVDHGISRRLWSVGIANYFSAGRVRTIGDVLGWAEIPLTAHQAASLDLCKPVINNQPITITADPFQRGIASWYGPGFHGQLAAAGEVYNMYALTAAHPTLPLSSLVRVVYPLTGRSVVVRINDRGPYAGGRIIDLSYAAKRNLHMEDLARVYLERLDPSALEAPCK